MGDNQQPGSIEYAVNSSLTNDQLNELFARAWPNFQPRDFQPVLARSLGYVCAFSAGSLIGFVNLAWDGGVHAFLLDATVDPDFQRQGIGQALVLRAVDLARSRGMEWLHVDYEPHLENFYRSCGFEPTPAGLISLNE